MVSKTFLATCAAALFAGVATAQPVDAAHHAHNKLEERAIDLKYVYKTITVDGNGNPIPATTSAPANVVALAEPTSQAPAPVTTSSTPAPQVVTSSAPAPASSPAQSSSAPASQPAASSGGISGDLAPFANPTQEFQDGTIDCSSFPAGQGVIALDNLGFGGWSGIELPLSGGTFSSPNSCQEGAYCSYACQSGMSKTQWPESQPASGVSVGGLMCKGGKLYRTNTNTNYLCEWGVNSAIVTSQLSQDVAICRTDYPGTENMVIPTVVTAGGQNTLTVVDQGNYYMWEGKPTSAQFYVNNAGVSYEDGCIWGTPGSGIGNWAPLNFGAGSANGISYLSIIPNPNNRSPANFNVKIIATDGATVNGQCVYENGQYNGGGSDGCTVAVTNGKAQFVLY